MDQNIEHRGKVLKLYITEEKIQKRVQELAAMISNDFKGLNPLVIGILNGAFMFLADLSRQLTIHDYDIDFVKFSSYEGTESTGQVSELIGLKSSIKDRHVLIVDDILESGQTLDKILKFVQSQGAASIKSCVFVNKPGKLKLDIKADYVGLDIDDVFIIGYGMDWDERFRGLKQLYYAVDKE